MLLHAIWLLLQLGVGGAKSEQQFAKEGYYCYGDGHLHTGQPCRFFAIVIDAGSTGTRLQLYRFVHSTHKRGLPFHAEEEVFHEVKPGLSSFFARPSEAAASVRVLIEKARGIVPEGMWRKTPIVVKATAGLRLLPGDAAQRILEKVDSLVRSSGLACMGECVGILDGSDEGIYSWFTLNLLLQRFYRDSHGNEVDPSPGRSAAAFDLGGGSTQVTFWPSSDGVFEGRPEFRRDIDFFQTHMHLYTHSYLGAGLQSARLSIVQGEGWNGEERRLESPCFPPSFRLEKWEQAHQEWSVSGSPSYSYEACQKTVSQFIRRMGIDQLESLPPSTHLYLFSYFFDRARQAGILKEGERVTVGSWKAAAQKACTTPSFPSDAPHWLPWQCADFSYVYGLLREGYGFEEEREIVPVNSINGMGVSWALGLAYSLVDEYHEKRGGEDVEESEEEEIKDHQGRVNATGVELVDEILTVISQRTTDVLQFFNIVS